MPDFNSYSLFVQILVSSFHCTMKTPKTHVLFVENIEWMAVVATHNALQTTQNQMDCSRRVLTTVLFPEFDSKQGQPLCKTFGMFRLQNVPRTFLAATFIAFSDPLIQSPSSLLIAFLCALWNDTLRSTLQGFSTSQLSKTSRAVTVALALCPRKRLEISIVRVLIFHS